MTYRTGIRFDAVVFIRGFYGDGAFIFRVRLRFFVLANGAEQGVAFLITIDHRIRVAHALDRIAIYSHVFGQYQPAQVHDGTVILDGQRHIFIRRNNRHVLQLDRAVVVINAICFQCAVLDGQMFLIHDIKEQRFQGIATQVQHAIVGGFIQFSANIIQ